MKTSILLFIILMNLVWSTQVEQVNKLKNTAPSKALTMNHRLLVFAQNIPRNHFQTYLEQKLFQSDLLSKGQKDWGRFLISSNSKLTWNGQPFKSTQSLSDFQPWLQKSTKTMVLINRSIQYQFKHTKDLLVWEVPLNRQELLGWDRTELENHFKQMLVKSSSLFEEWHQELETLNLFPVQTLLPPTALKYKQGLFFKTPPLGEGSEAQWLKRLWSQEDPSMNISILMHGYKGVIDTVETTFKDLDNTLINTHAKFIGIEAVTAGQIEFTIIYQDNWFRDTHMFFGQVHQSKINTKNIELHFYPYTRDDYTVDKPKLMATKESVLKLETSK